MITRRKLLKGIAGAAAVSVAAPALLKSERGTHQQYDWPEVVQTQGFGLAQAKPEGGRIYYDTAYHNAKVSDPNSSWRIKT